MSTYYYVLCKSCEERVDPIMAGSDTRAFLREAYQAREEIFKLFELLNRVDLLFSWITLTVHADYSFTPVIQFMAVHAHHPLELWDEYGYQYDWELDKRLEGV